MWDSTIEIPVDKLDGVWNMSAQNHDSALGGTIRVVLVGAVLALLASPSAFSQTTSASGISPQTGAVASDFAKATPDRGRRGRHASGAHESRRAAPLRKSRDRANDGLDVGLHSLDRGRILEALLPAELLVCRGLLRSLVLSPGSGPSHRHSPAMGRRIPWLRPPGGLARGLR